MCKRKRRVATVRAESYCNVFTLTAEHFTAILEHHPDMKSTMEYVARERLQNLAAATSHSNFTEPHAASNDDDVHMKTKRTENRHQSTDKTVIDADVDVLSVAENERTVCF